ncbi:hypothetical protein [Streptomyces sp. TRM68367]|uniref:hypothetical protein n=1 Tax=Streptomyces sp. TRM68367 TaxID=2758415 RepID=UPI00165A64CC|nr:hypothetical protein [Streptomyces sp. TRM68367]MBC9728044.1 hypothetical protein [Streptomyces sp. TRM68367]
MSPAPHRAVHALAHSWPRMLVLLLILLVPLSLATAPALPAATVVSERGGTPAEYDLLDTAARPPARSGRRPVAPLRPAPPPLVPAASATARPAPAPPGPSRPPYALRALRSVVLRC